MTGIAFYIHFWQPSPLTRGKCNVLLLTVPGRQPHQVLIYFYSLWCLFLISTLFPLYIWLCCLTVAIPFRPFSKKLKMFIYIISI